MRRRSPQSIVFMLLAATVVVVCFNAWLAWHAVEDLAESERWVSHSWHVIDSLDQIVNDLKDAETGTQGYLLSGNEAYLGPYKHAQIDLPLNIATVARLVSDNPSQEKLLPELKAVIESRMSLLDQSIQERRNGGTNSLHLQVLGGTGEAEMKHVEGLLGRMHDTEQTLRTARVQTWRRDSQRAEWTVLFASLVDLLLLLLMFRYVIVERRLLQRANETTEHLQKLQSISDVALTRLTADQLTVELLNRAGKAIDADCVLLCTRSEGVFTVEASAGTQIAKGTVIPSAGAGLLDRAIDQDRIVKEIDSASAFNLPDQIRRNSRSLMVAPLSAATDFEGTLVAGRQIVQDFSAHDEEMLSVAAHRIAMALDRARAFEAERKARQEAENRAEEVRVLNAELEERVRYRTAELEITNQELESFSYSVSHDLRAPLRTVDGFSLAFEEDYGSGVDPQGLDYLRRIREGVQRMGQLIDSLLQLSRITRVPLVREPVDLTDMGWTIARELTAQNPDRVIEFQISTGMNCTGDARLLRAALENLLGNAVKFTAREPVAKIEFGCTRDAYFVKDNGAGFDMRYADKLFGAFNRLHGDREFRGSGIGLATVARIIRRHQGNIWAESVVGQGATFWFTLEPDILKSTAGSGDMESK